MIGKLSEEKILLEAGVRPTSNRILVVRHLANSDFPMSLGELEEKIDTLEKSSILRVLTLLLENHLVHALEDGRGVVKYELCRSHDHHDGPDSDMHVHFYCRKCGRTLCLENVPVPHIPVDDGFSVDTANFMLKGICRDCNQLP